MKQHLTYAGAQHDIYSDGAMDEIYRFSRGTARLVNMVSTHCLIYGAQNGHRIIDDHIVKRVIRENYRDSPCFSRIVDFWVS
jgi:general secretion pathway protein A